MSQLTDDAESKTRGVIPYLLSPFFFITGVAILIVGANTYASAWSDERMMANDGTARYGWTLIAACQAFAGLLWTVAAVAYLKRRPGVGHWIVLTGLFALLLSMLVIIPV
ncbi:hypothetical protein [Planctomycetes bacterium CA13]|uniref:hypothetical protein n=1 Tax=Novipirellula herctigrandis TaxID=2527986 RepID=UPI0011B7C078